MFEKEYEAKKLTIDQCIKTIKSDDKIFIGLYGGEPTAIMREIHKVAPQLKNVEIWKATDMEDFPVFLDDSLKGHIDMRSIFYGKTARKIQNQKRTDYLPNDLHDVMKLKNQYQPCNIFMVKVAPMDENGFFSLGSWVQIERDAMDAAETIIFEVNSQVPRVNGDTKVHINDIDFIVEAETGMPDFPPISYTDVDQLIGENVATLISDGDCIQLGIGGTSNVVALNLLGKRDLGIHSEMFTDSMMELMEKGVINNSKKTIHKDMGIVSFAWGSDQLYRFLDENKQIEFRRSSYVNNPFIIAQNDNMVSINTTMQVDLTGQVCSESIGPLHYSGAGGAFDFAYGALHSNGGKGIIAMSSTAKNGTVSRIQPMLREGAAVTITRNVVDNVVTEYGVAKLRGRTIRERTKNLISIAHPDFRKDLEREAQYLLLW